MARASGDLWLKQARSDLDCAARVLDKDDGSTYCHAIAKYQQAVEKSLKGVVAALQDVGIAPQGPTYMHGLDAEIRMLKLLPHNRSKGSRQELVGQVKTFLDTNFRSDLQAISGLAPRKPAEGELEPKNTEYPFQILDGNWTVPAAVDAFTYAEVENFRRIAGVAYDKAYNIVFSAKLVTRKGR